MFYGFGSAYGGSDDKREDFINLGVVCIGWQQEEAPAWHQMLRQINVGDIIFIKSFPPRHGLYIKAIGMVTSPTVTSIGNLGTGREVNWLWIPDSKVSAPWLTFGRLNDSYDQMRSGAMYVEHNPLVQKKILEKIVGPKSIRLTCNQMMILLSVFRGTHAHEMKIGTHYEDINFLRKQGLIDSSEMELTPEGLLFVKNRLGK